MPEISDRGGGEMMVYSGDMRNVITRLTQDSNRNEDMWRVVMLHHLARYPRMICPERCIIVS